MYNPYFNEELNRIHREEALARAEHERFMKANGLDLWSVVGRAVSARLARVHLPSVRVPRVSLFERREEPDLHLVSRAQLERRFHRAA